MEDKRPRIAITIGDPSGIGPEIAIKSLLREEVYRMCRPILIGDLRLLRKISEEMMLNAKFKALRSPSDVLGRKGIIEVIDLKNIDIDDLRIGAATAQAGEVSIQYVEKAVEYALRREVDAIVTGPINKKSIRLAGCSHIGHTEMIAALSGVEDPLTMFWVRGARIFFLTRHMPLEDAIKYVKRTRIIDTTLKIVDALKKIGIEKPRVAVAALNPHASDGGLIGKEEEEEISPAVEDLRKKGIDAYGPVPADSVFHQAVEGRFDAVLSLYHDQGHIAAKTLNFYGTVSVTLGLRFIRTSVDHGTAYEIAGKGIANSKSLEEAMKLAAHLVSRVRDIQKL